MSLERRDVFISMLEFGQGGRHTFHRRLSTVCVCVSALPLSLPIFCLSTFASRAQVCSDIRSGRQPGFSHNKSRCSNGWPMTCGCLYLWPMAQPMGWPMWQETRPSLCDKRHHLVSCNTLWLAEQFCQGDSTLNLNYSVRYRHPIEAGKVSHHQNSTEHDFSFLGDPCNLRRCNVASEDLAPGMCLKIEYPQNRDAGCRVNNLVFVISLPI